MKKNKVNKTKVNKRGKYKKILIIECVLLVISIAVLYFAFVFEGKLNKMQRTDALNENEAGINKEILDSEKRQQNKKHYETLVLYGVDSRQNQLEEGTNSDVIMICGIDNKKKEIRITSVYRDTYMDNGREDGVISLKRCNSAYLYGYKQSIRMLNRNLDLDIKSYATASFAAVTKAIDAMGGVQLEITDKEARQINRYLAETAHVAGVKANFLQKGGDLLLDGAQATTYARIRKGVGDDYSRANRQRIVVKKMFEKAKHSDWGTINKVLDSVLPLVSTNLTNTQIFNYAQDLLSYDIVETRAFPFNFTATYVGRASVLVPINLEENVKELHAYLYPDKATEYVPSETVKEISNKIKIVTGVTDSTKGIEVQYYNGEDANKVGNTAPPKQEEQEGNTENKGGTDTTSK